MVLWRNREKAGVAVVQWYQLPQVGGTGATGVRPLQEGLQMVLTAQAEALERGTRGSGLHQTCLHPLSSSGGGIAAHPISQVPRQLAFWSCIRSCVVDTGTRDLDGRSVAEASSLPFRLLSDGKRGHASERMSTAMLQSLCCSLLVLGRSPWWQ